MHPVQEQLVRALSRLPGIGKRSAERISQRLISDRNGATEVMQALRTAGGQLLSRSQCGYITDRERDPCIYCSQEQRDASVLCVVDAPVDVDLIEQSGAYRGRYFCLMGKISASQGEALRDETLQRLVEWIKRDNISEIILALNADVESDATASYLSQLFSQLDVNVSRLAMGIPAGSGLAYSDPVTVSRALTHRQKL